MRPGWLHIQAFGAVPQVPVWDGEGAVGRWHGGHPLLIKKCVGFRGVLGSKVVICRPGDPEAKGRSRARQARTQEPDPFPFSPRLQSQAFHLRQPEPKVPGRHY